MPKYIENFEERYLIYENGDIWAKPNRYTGYKGRILKPKVNKYGYFQLDLCKNGKSFTKNVHRLVAETFIENKKNLPVVNHKDGNKLNNDVNNLEWCSYKENTHHMMKNNIKGWNEKILKTITTYNEKHMYKKVILFKEIETHQFNSTKEASKFLNTSNDNITRAFRNKNKCKGYNVICERTANGETSAYNDGGNPVGSYQQ